MDKLELVKELEKNELVCPVCDRVIGKIEKTEFTPKVILLRCSNPDCNNIDVVENFLPQNVEKAKKQAEAEAAEQQRLAAEAAAKKQAETEAAEQQILATDATASRETADAAELQRLALVAAAKRKIESFNKSTEENATKVVAMQGSTEEPITRAEHIMQERPTQVHSKIPQIAQVRINDGEPKRLKIGGNMIGREHENKDANKGWSTILFKASNHVSREHLMINVATKRDDSGMQYTYKASLFKDKVNTTLLNGKKMEFSIQYDLKDGDVITFPDGTKLTLLNKA